MATSTIRLGDTIVFRQTEGEPGRLCVPHATTAQRTAMQNVVEGCMVYDTDLSSFYAWVDGDWVEVGAGGGGASPLTLVRKDADQTFNSTTQVDVSNLSFAVTAGRYYEFRFTVLFRSDTSTVGLGLAVTSPAFTRFGYAVKTIIAGDGAGGMLQGAGTSSGDAVLGTAVPAINTDYIAEVVGVIVPSANGTLQLRARTETGTTVVTVRQGSVGVLSDFGT